MPEHAWDQWLWGEDPLQEAGTGQTAWPLNRMQMLGLLVARYKVAN